MLLALSAYLDEEGYRWLGACAVYPSLEWPLTLALGRTFLGHGSEPILDDGRLAALVRLPWFRYGAMPDWLRKRLLRKMSGRQVGEARRAIEVLLGTPAKITARGDILEVPPESSTRSQRADRGGLRDLIEGEPEGGPLRDPLFMDVALGRRSEPRSFPILRSLRWWAEDNDERDGAPIRPSWIRSLFSMFLGRPYESVRRPGARQLIVACGTYLDGSRRTRVLDEFPDADFLFLRAGTTTLASRDFRAVAPDWRRLIDEFWEGAAATLDPEAAPPYDEMIWVADVPAAFVVRQCFLDAALGIVPPSSPARAGEQPPWLGRLSRIIFLGGFNQGWDLRTVSTRQSSVLSVMFGAFRAFRPFGFLFSTERGSPGVVALNIRWARELARAPLARFPTTVQVLRDWMIDGTPEAALTELRNPPGVPPCATVLLPPHPNEDQYFDFAVRAIRGPDPAPDATPAGAARVDRVVFVLAWDPPKEGEVPLAERVAGVVRERKLNALVHAVPPPGTPYATYYALDLRDPDRGRLNEFLNRYADAVTRFPGVEVSVVVDSGSAAFLGRAFRAYDTLRVNRLACVPGSIPNLLKELSYMFNYGFLRLDYFTDFCWYNTFTGAFQFSGPSIRNSRYWADYDQMEGPLPRMIEWTLGLLPVGGPDDAGSDPTGRLPGSRQDR
jgi:hypothetical protein